MKEVAEDKRLFDGMGTRITTDSRRPVGAALGTKEFEERFVKSIISTFVQQVTRLDEVAQIQLQAAHAGNGLS